MLGPEIEPQEEFVVSENNFSRGCFPLGWSHEQRQVRPGCFRPPKPEATGSCGCSCIKLAAHETIPVVFGEQGAVQPPMVHKGYAQRSSYHASVGRPRFLTQGPALRKITIAKCLLWSTLLRTGGMSWMVFGDEGSVSRFERLSYRELKGYNGCGWKTHW